MDEIRKYMSEESVNEIAEVFEKAINTKILAFLPVIISGIGLILLSIFAGIQNSSILFGILIFICLSPLLIFSIASFSVGNAFKSLVHCINFLFQTTVNISVAVYRDNKDVNKESFDAMRLGKYSFNNILLPVLKTVAKKRFLGAIILKFVEIIFKTVFKTISKKAYKDSFNKSSPDNKSGLTAGLNELYEDRIKRDANDLNCESESENTNEMKLIRNADKINSITMTSIKSILILSRVLAVLLALIGIFLTVILLLINEFVNF